MTNFRPNSNIKLALIAVFCTVSVLSYPNETIGVPELAWQKEELNVCWQTDLSRLKQDVGGWTLYNYQAWPASNTLQNEVKSAVQATYTNDEIGIGFRGFDACPSDPGALSNYSVYLVNHMQIREETSSPLTETASGASVVGDQNRTKKLKSVFAFLGEARTTGSPHILSNASMKTIQWKSAVGFDLDEDSSSMKKHWDVFRQGLEKAMGFNPREKTVYNEQSRIRKSLAQVAPLLQKDARSFTILHEFGHVLGLLHEDRRHDAETNRPSYCSNVAHDADHENNGSIDAEEVRFGTDYDPFSIMSYCRATMHTLYREAEVVCGLSSIIKKRILDAKRLSEREREIIRDFLVECPTLHNYPFSVGITARDLNSLNQMYSRKVSYQPDAISYHASEKERYLAELFEKIADLPFVNRNPSR